MHTPVLLKETREFLDLKNGNVAVDATADGGGHLEILLDDIGENGAVLGIDQDKEMISRLRQKFEKQIREGKLKLFLGNFRNIDSAFEFSGLEKADGILFDLGMSSLQLEESGRGFSFLKPDEPLFMTYKSDPVEKDLTAVKILNEWSREKIEEILKNFGEERFSKKISAEIANTRRKKSFIKVGDLVETVRRAVPGFYAKRRIHFATKTFQALRIAVNSELDSLKEGLEKSFNLLDTGGRMAVISFHYLEDKIAKEFFKEKKKHGSLKLLAPKPITPSRGEILLNPRSRSAKLRVCEKIMD